MVVRKLSVYSNSSESCLSDLLFELSSAYLLDFPAAGASFGPLICISPIELFMPYKLST